MEDFYMDIRKYIEQDSEKYNDCTEDYIENKKNISNKNDILYDNYNNKYFQYNNYLNNCKDYENIDDYNIFYKNYDFLRNNIYNKNNY